MLTRDTPACADRFLVHKCQEAMAPQAEAQVAPVVAPAEALTVDLQNVLGIPGLMHIVHNASSDMFGAMCHDAYLGKLKQVCHLLRRPWSRPRFFETCLPSGPYAAAHRDVYKSFNGHAHAERWGIVTQAVSQLVEVESNLRAYWSKQK